LLIAGAVAGQVCAGRSLIQVLFPSGRSNGNYGPPYQAETMAGHFAIDTAGNVYVLDGWNLPYDSGPIRKITLGGTIVPAAGFGTSALPPGLSTPALLAGVG
jgi:hypothetical protein